MCCIVRLCIWIVGGNVMQQVDEMPTSGKFVVVWQFDGEVLSDVMYWLCGSLISSTLDIKTQQDVIDDFMSDDKITDIKYFIAD
jgi:hypothetical protein